jgi:hypothetical protein
MAVGGFSERLAFLLELDPTNAVAGMRRVGEAADRELGKTDDRLNRLGGRMQAFGAGAVVAAGVAGRALFGFAQAFEEAEAESRKLDLALANAPQLAGATRDAFEDLADQLQDTTTAEGDAVIGLEGMLGTLGRTQDQILELTPLIVDLATRYGLSFEQAGRLVNNAVEGNTTRLERLIGQMGEGETVTEALRRSVGGFAEGEAKTLQGQLEILKNNLGDVAEGIGGGVVGAINNMIGPLKSGAEWFTRLDAGTQNTIGTFATYGTAAVGVVGATSFVIGSVLKMVDNFKQAKDALERFSGALTQLGAIGGIVALGTAGAAALDRLEDSLISARISMEDLSRASDEELVRSIDMGVSALTNFGQSADDLYASLAQNGIGTLERYRDALEAAGRPTEAITAAIEAEAVAQANATATRDAGTEAIEGADAATDGLTGATDENTAATERNTAATVTAAEAQQARLTATLAQFDADLRYAESQRATADAIQDATTATDDAATASDEVAAAYDNAAGAALAQADAAVDAANKQAGGALTAQQAAQIQIAELGRVRDTLAPGSPLRVYLDGYISQLERTNRTFTSTFQQNYVGNAQGATGPRVSFNAAGGTPAPVARVNERGVELYTDDLGHDYLLNGQGGRITPNDQLAAASAGVNTGRMESLLEEQNRLLVALVSGLNIRNIARGVREWDRSLKGAI